MNFLDWQQAGLTENPFRTVPPTDPTKVVWADLKDLKKELDDVFREALTSRITQVVLNWGRFGGGKTHASRYYSLDENLPPIKGKRVRRSLSLYTRVPKEPAKADVNFYIGLLEQLKLNNVRKVIKEMITSLGEETSLKLLQDHTESEDLGQALWMYGKEQDPERINLLRRFFLSGCTRTELATLRLGRGVTTLEDRFKVLGAIFQSYIGFPDGGNIQNHTRLILWIDEMEDLIYFTAKQYRPFTQGIRDLIDRLPNYFTLFMNFTLTTPEAFEDIGIILGEAIMSRISKHVYFKELSLPEAKLYVSELLAHFRTPEVRTAQQPYYPFEEEALEEAIEELTIRTPREINKRCSNLIQAAIQDGVFKKGGKDRITREYVKKIDKARLEAEID